MPRRGLPAFPRFIWPLPGLPGPLQPTPTAQLVPLKPPCKQVYSDHCKGKCPIGESYASNKVFSEVAAKYNPLPLRLVGLFGLWLDKRTGVDVHWGTWQILSLAFRDFSSSFPHGFWADLHFDSSLTLVLQNSHCWFFSGKSRSGVADQLVLSQLGQIKSGIRYLLMPNHRCCINNLLPTNFLSS